MRSEFEKLPQIESHLHNVVFDEGTNEYLAKKMGHLPFEFSEWFLNGSWLIYQHQQSKVDELQVLYTQQGVNMLKLQKRLDKVKREVCIFSEFIKRFDEHTDTATIMGTLDGFVDGLEQALKGDEA